MSARLGLGAGSLQHHSLMSASLRPIPAFLTEGVGADRGLICGFQFGRNAMPREISADTLLESLERPATITWLHFNLSESRARRWLLESQLIPGEMRDVLREQDGNRRVELVDDGLLLVMSDFSYEESSDPSEVGPLWCYATANRLTTARIHPLKSIDDLRLAMRAPSQATSGFELAAQVLELRTLHLRRRAHVLIARLDDIEDEILAGDIREQREHLGRTRRVCARWRREFAPERADLAKFLHRQASQFTSQDAESLRAVIDSLGFAIEEVAELYERAKLLQEELASRLAEGTGRNLYVLSILTAVLLPMTLITGIFGMNVAGLPGQEDSGSFWRVMLLVVASGVVTLLGLLYRRLL